MVKRPAWSHGWAPAPSLISCALLAALQPHPPLCCWFSLPGSFLHQGLHLLFLLPGMLFPHLRHGSFTHFIEVFTLFKNSLPCHPLASCSFFSLHSTYLYLKLFIDVLYYLSHRQIWNKAPWQREVLLVLFTAESLEPGMCLACGWNLDIYWLNE